MKSESPATSSPRRLLRLLQPLIGVALLAFVAWLVPWRDELIVKVEGHVMNGAALCSPRDNDEFEESWFLLALKVTFSF